MKFAGFDYAAPASVEEVIRVLAAAGEDAKLLAGGQSLLPTMAFRLAAPRLLVDLRKVEGLDGIQVDAAGVRLGARVRWCDILAHPGLRHAHPLLVRAVSHVAHYQVRNRGTVGGSLAHADPAAELPGVAVACEGILEVQGPRGRRDIPADAFFTGPLSTVLEKDEVILALRLPAFPAERRWAFQEFSLRRGDFALAGVALHGDLAEGKLREVRVGAIGVGDRARRLEATEKVLEGRTVSAEALAAAVQVARDEVSPRGDLHASADYRRALFCTLLERALREAFA